MALRWFCLASFLAVSGCAAGSPHPLLTLPRRDQHPPLRCRGMENVVLRDVTIDARRDGLRVGGHCKVTLYDSEIVGGRFGVAVTGFGRVRLVDTTVEGDRGWLFASGFSSIEVVGGATRGPTRINQYARVDTDAAVRHVD